LTGVFFITPSGEGRLHTADCFDFISGGKKKEEIGKPNRSVRDCSTIEQDCCLISRNDRMKGRPEGKGIGSAMQAYSFEGLSF
jgi:hypothetical protein